MSPFQKNVSDFQKIMNQALQLLARRDHTAKELETKLKRRGHETEMILEVLSKCRGLKYIDESSMANRFVVERKRKNYGPYHIKQSLKKKGVSEKDIATALERHYPHEEEMEAAYLAVAKKIRQLRKLCDSETQKQKVYSHLLYRGFSPEVVQQVLSTVLKKY